MDSTGGVHTWGGNEYSQLGNSSTIESHVPISISTIDGSILNGKKIVAIAAGGFHNLALDDTGAVYAWGFNIYGEIGDGTFSTMSNPIELQGGDIGNKLIVAIACGYHHSIALDNFGKIYIWGQAVGDDNANLNLPKDISSKGSILDKAIVAITAGIGYTVALDSTGTVHVWGVNGNGELGTGDTISMLEPVSLSGKGSFYNKQIIAIASSLHHCIALDNNGAVHTWGANQIGQLGTGNQNAYLEPVLISNTETILYDKTIVAVSAGAGHSIAVDNTGATYAWGFGEHGQMGDGTTNNMWLPTQIQS